MNDFYRRNSSIGKHIQYRESPILFIQEQWVGINMNHSFKVDKISPYAYQENIIREIEDSPFTLIASSRQMGISSLLDAYIAWYAIFNPDKTILIVCNNSESSMHHLKRIKLILNNYKVDGLFDFEKDCEKDNKKEIKLSNGSRIIAGSPTADACKGYEINLMVFDNAAYIKNLENIYLSCCLNVYNIKNGRIIMSSSPCDNSFFNKLALEIKNTEKDTKDKLLEIKWDLHPKRTKDWYDAMCNQINYNQSQIDQELDCVINYKDKSSKDKTISLRIPHKLYKEIKIKIGEEGSVSDYIRNIIEKDLGV